MNSVLYSTVPVGLDGEHHIRKQRGGRSYYLHSEQSGGKPARFPAHVASQSVRMLEEATARHGEGLATCSCLDDAERWVEEGVHTQGGPGAAVFSNMFSNLTGNHAQAAAPRH